MDLPLTALAAKIGEDEAVRRWRRVRRALNGLWDRFDQVKIPSDRVACPSLYLDGDLLNDDGLRAETDLRVRHAEA